MEMTRPGTGTLAPLPVTTRIPGRRVDLRAGMLWRSDGGCAVRITVITGMVWLTEEEDRLDHLLVAGEEMILPARGVVLAEALEGAAAFRVVEAMPD
ncbi:MAG: DUF2917 domain-containing protein [Candidatus Kapaibacterium sp.]